MANKQKSTEIKVGLFVILGVALIMLAILILGGGTQTLFSSKNHYMAHFGRVDGLAPGAKVILGGVPVGTVDTIEFNRENRNIKVDFTVERTAGDLIRQDSRVEIATQGVLGDKYISIDVGGEDQPILPPESDIPIKPSKDLTQFLSKGDQLMLSLNGVAASLDRILKNFETDNRSETFFKNMTGAAKNLNAATEKLNHELDQSKLKEMIGNMNQITEKINNGTGTIGALVNDSGLYDELRALMGGANRNRIIRNLVRQTIKSTEETTTPEPTLTPKPRSNP